MHSHGGGRGDKGELLSHLILKNMDGQCQVQQKVGMMFD